jgi:hypothetical protein
MVTACGYKYYDQAFIDSNPERRKTDTFVRFLLCNQKAITELTQAFYLAGVDSVPREIIIVIATTIFSNIYRIPAKIVTIARVSLTVAYTMLLRSIFSGRRVRKCEMTPLLPIKS